MKFKFLISAILLPTSLMAAGGEDLWESFVHPSREARTKLWWFHGETETTREGIDADLTAFKEAGIGGVVFYDQTHGKQDGASPSMSAEWWEMLRYAALKARKLGLTFDMASTNGYVAGGPWITPETGMKKIVTLRPGESAPAGFRELIRLSVPVVDEIADTLVVGDKITLTDNQSATIEVDFGRPTQLRTISYNVTPRGKGSFGSMNVSGKPQELYSGAGYVHFPPVGQLEWSDDGLKWNVVTDLRGVEDVIGHKSRQRTINFPAVSARHFRVRIHDWLEEDSAAAAMRTTPVPPNQNRYRKLQLSDVRLMGYDMTDNWEEKSGLRSEIAWRPYDYRVDEDFVPFAGEVIIGYVPTGGQAKHGRKNIVWDGQQLSSKTWLEADVLSAEAARLHYNSYFKAVHDSLAAIGCAPGGMQLDSHEAGIANWTQEMPSHFSRLRGYDITPWLPALGGYIVGSRRATEKFLKDFRLTISQLVREQFYGTLDSLCRRDGVVFTSQAMLGCVNDNIASRGVTAKPQGEFWAYQSDGNYDCLDASSAAHLYGRRVASGEAFTDAPYFFPTDSADSDWKERGWHHLLRIANIAYCRGVNEFVVCASTYQPWLDRKYDDTQSAHPYIFHRHNPAWDKSRDHFWEYQARCSQMLQPGRPVVDILVYLGDEVPVKTMTYKLPEIPEGYQFDCATLASLRHWMDHPSELSPAYKVLAVQARSSVSAESESLFDELEKRGMIIVRCDRGETLAGALEQAGLSPDLRIRSNDRPDDKVYFCHRAADGADIYFVYNHSAEPWTGPIEPRTPSADIELWDPLTLERRSEVGELSLAPYSSVFLIARNSIQ